MNPIDRGTQSRLQAGAPGAVSQDAPLAALGSVRWKKFAAIALVMLWLVEFFPALAVASRLQRVNPESGRRFANPERRKGGRQLIAKADEPDSICKILHK
jgi:hypothetical protein